MPVHYVEQLLDGKANWLRPGQHRRPGPEAAVGRLEDGGVQRH